jgi:hypothetical protein
MRGKSSVADGSGECPVVTLVLAGMGEGELGDRTVEDGASAEVANLRTQSAAHSAHGASAVARDHPTDGHSVTAQPEHPITTAPTTASRRLPGGLVLLD